MDDAPPPAGHAHPGSTGGPDRQTIGQRIRLARKAARLNQGELADRLGVTQPTVANWEAGVHDPRQLVLGKLARSLDVSLGWLAGGEAAVGARPAPPVPGYLRTGIQHVPILGEAAALRVAEGMDPHAAASDYLPFAHASGRLVALRLPAEGAEGAAHGDTIVVADCSRREPAEGALVVCCGEAGPVMRPWRPGAVGRVLGTALATIRFH